MQAASIAKVVCLLTVYTRDTHHPHNGDTTSHAAAHDRVFNTQRLAYDAVSTEAAMAHTIRMGTSWLGVLSGGSHRP